MSIISESLQKIIWRQVDSLGYALWGIEVIPRRHSYLARIFIDKKQDKGSDSDKKASKNLHRSIGLEDCVAVNRALDLCLQEENIQLEVSTPGLARKFFTASQYEDYIGSKIKIKTKKMIDGQRNFTGELVATDDKNLQIKIENTDKILRHGDILIGQLEPDYNQILKQQ